jgi:hypothetical protein
MMTARLAIVLAIVLALAAAAPSAASRSRFPVGSFRTTITDADLRAGHATNDIPENHGTFTLTIHRNGHWRLVQKAPNPVLDPVFTGTYSVRGRLVDFKTVTPAQFGGDDIVAWRLVGSILHLKLRSKSPYPESYVLYDAHPWRKVA